MFKRICLFSLPLLLTGSVAFGQVTITRKFNEGESYKSKTSSKTTQKLTIAGQDGGTTSNTVIEQKTTNGKKDADGKLPITVDTSVLSAEISLPGGINIKFDGKNPDAKVETGGNPIAELVLEKLKGNAKMTTTVIMAKDNTVADVQGIKADSGVSADDIKEEFAQQLKMLPSKPLKKGDTWEAEVKVNLGSGQIFTLKRKFTFEGETTKSTVDSTRKVLKITSVDSAVTFSVKEGGAPFKVSKSELKVDESKNVTLFDPAIGRTIESNSVLRVSGKIALSVNNMDLPGDLDLTLSSQMEEIK
ncbi:MAG: DUF6263 family protein [Pirellulaceae bacterium]